MSEQRLIDANKIFDEYFYEMHGNFSDDYAKGFQAGLYVIRKQSVIDPETLPIVQELREKLEQVTAERDAAVEQLRGYCPSCKNYAAYHGEGPCEECKHEYYIYRTSDARDNWEWCGPDGYRRIEMEIQNDG